MDVTHKSDAMHLVNMNTVKVKILHYINSVGEKTNKACRWNM